MTKIMFQWHNGDIHSTIRIQNSMLINHTSTGHNKTNDSAEAATAGSGGSSIAAAAAAARTRRSTSLPVDEDKCSSQSFAQYLFGKQWTPKEHGHCCWRPAVPSHEVHNMSAWYLISVPGSRQSANRGRQHSKPHTAATIHKVLLPSTFVSAEVDDGPPVPTTCVVCFRLILACPRCFIVCPA